MLRALVALHRRAGDLATARRAADDLVALDPYDEAGHELLVEVLGASGRPGEAQRVRDAHRAALVELGVVAPVPLVI